MCYCNRQFCRLAFACRVVLRVEGVFLLGFRGEVGKRKRVAHSRCAALFGIDVSGGLEGEQTAFGVALGMWGGLGRGALNIGGDAEGVAAKAWGATRESTTCWPGTSGPNLAA